MKKLNRRLKSIACILIFIHSCSLSFAGVEPEVKTYQEGDSIVSLGQNLDSSTRVILYDNYSYNEEGQWQSGTYLTTYPTTFKEYSIQNRAFLSLNENLDSCFLDTFTFGVKIRVKWKGLGGSVDSTDVWLYVNYDTSLLLKNKEISSYVFNQGLWSEVSILEFHNEQYKHFVKIGQSLNIERYRNLAADTIELTSVTPLSETNEVQFNWNSIDGAEEYDFEWLWLDAYKSDGSLYGASEISANFRKGATRVRVKGSEYSIPLVYERGYVVARVRPVGRNKDKKDQVTTGPWSSIQNLSNLTYLTEGSDYIVIDTTGTYKALNHQMNWQFVATFAEEGKRKEVVSFYDGSLRNRQSVTRINTDLRTVVGETIYDFEGRPAVNILPVPVLSADSQKLEYIPNFNKADSTSDSYNKEHFDKLVPEGTCGVSVTPLSPTSGASMYYSSSNNLVSRASGYIADANKYPMTVTEYMPDGTGRIKRQGGVGQTHQLDGGHETKYYYATPTSAELYRLFGSAVGDSTHYQKEMVFDPNGQASVSYKDLSGKVIATALAGEVPDSITQLPSFASAIDTFSVSFPSEYSTSNNEIFLSKNILVSSDNSLHEFTYGLDIPNLVLDDAPGLCFDCVYELKISLKDECGQEVLDGDPSQLGVQEISRVVGTSGDFDVECSPGGLSYSFNEDPEISGSTIQVYLNSGQYTLTKSLIIRGDAYLYYYEQYLKSTTAKSLYDFQVKELENSDTLECEMDCEECNTELSSNMGSYYSGRDAELTAQGYSDLSERTAIIDLEWQSLEARCNLKCPNNSSPCSDYYKAFIEQVSPGGKYAKYQYDDLGNLIPEGILNTSWGGDTSSGIKGNGLSFNKGDFWNGTNWERIKYTDNLGNPDFVNFNGYLVAPNDLSAEDYIKYFKKSWADSLVIHHPEYCSYLECAKYQASYELDMEMLSTTSFIEAYRKGYFDPLGDGSFNARFVQTPPSEADSFYSSNTTLHSNHKNNLVNRKKLGFNALISACNQYASILDLALITYYGKNLNTCQQRLDWLSEVSLDTNDMCNDKADALWAAYRGMYIGEKRRYLQTLNNSCPTMPSGYSYTFTPIDEIADETGIDDSETDGAVLSSSSETKFLAKCDTFCESQRDYWLSKLDSCDFSADTLQREDLMDEFVTICQNGCDDEHPLGASSFPLATNGTRDGKTTTYASFEEAFEGIVDLEIRNQEGCDPWRISTPVPYERGMFALANINDSCLLQTGNGDTCYTNASQQMKDYTRMKQLLDANEECQTCVDCDEMQTALNDLASKYNVTVFRDSTWALKEVLTNYLNFKLGFNLHYWDYKDFAEECVSFGKTYNQVYYDFVATPFLEEEFKDIKVKPWETPEINVTNYQYASIGDLFYPPMPLPEATTFTSNTRYIDTCICNQLQDKLEASGVNLTEIESITPGTPLSALSYEQRLELEAFEDWLDDESCGENGDPNELRDVTKALLKCREFYKAFHPDADLSDKNWTQIANDELNTYSANDVDQSGLDGFSFEDAESCFTGCTDNKHPSKVNPFWTPISPIEDCPDCGVVAEKVDSILLANYPGSEDVIFDIYFKEPLLDAIFCSIYDCKGREDSLTYKYLPTGGGVAQTSKVSTSTIKAAMTSVLSSFYSSLSPFCKSNMFNRSTGSGQCSNNTTDTLLAKFSDCLPFHCGGNGLTGDYRRPKYTGPTDTSADTTTFISAGCCADTTIYKDLILPFFNDFTVAKNWLGNQFSPSHPILVGTNHPNYINTSLYDGNCINAVKVKTSYSKSPYKQVVMEDNCGDKFVVDLKFANNYDNQANYSRITRFDSLKVRGYRDGSCSGTSKFTIYATQFKGNKTDSFLCKILGTISDYELISVYNKIDDACDRQPPTLCNRAFGTIEHIIPDPCKTWKKMRAATWAQVKYEAYLDSLQDDFRQKYYNKCMSARDSMDMDYELKEYHYTLYYYDQAGNLTQTVPPAGVNYMDKGLFTQIAKSKKDTSLSLYPNHALVTKYRYNSLNEVRWQMTPDGDTSKFWYDRLGRMVVSQNAEQRDQAIDRFSYTEYDELGRIDEVGEIMSNIPMDTAKAFNQVSLEEWLDSNIKTEITRTWYDNSPFSIDFLQQNLRGRVVSMAYYTHDDSSYQHAVHYDYDIHGNVKTLLRENVPLHAIDQGFKQVAYDYDLVSGNVNNVYYQKGQDDQFTHSYRYDADNRLTDVFTSSDGLHWDRDAEYFYFLHGPLKRVQLGELLVQGMDYAYTIHGWLKAVNGNNLIADNDIGRDGSTLTSSPPNINASTARDVFGFSLHYYNGDYESINGHTDPSGGYTAQSFLIKDDGSSFAGSVKQLYNGNISRMVSALGKLGGDAIIGRSYEYDQLNRISKAHTYDNISSNSWLSTGSSSSFTSEYTYDANGNILSLKRNAEGGVAMDDLSYHYKSGTNQLTYVDDTVSSSAFTHDLDDQSSGNYTYDKIGNLVSDVSEEIETIEWTVYGKIKSISRVSGSAKPDLSFEYSPDGHRVAKHVLDTNGQTTSTWYSRDASGNIMATYKREWIDPATNNGVTVMDIYDQLVIDQSYDSRLQLLDQELDWINSVPSYTLDTVKNNISNAQASSVLSHFSVQSYLGSTETTAIYDGMFPDGVLAVLHNNGITDPQIYGILCSNNFTDLLTDQITYDFYNFLDYLHQLSPSEFDAIVTDLAVNPFQPINDQINDIILASTPGYIASFLAGRSGSADCAIYQSIFGIVIGFDHSGAWDILKGVSGFKATMWSEYTWQTWLSFFETGLGNKATWDLLFLEYPNTQSTWLSTVKTAEGQAFLFYALLELEDEELLRKCVSYMTGKTIEDWLDAVEAEYGLEYVNSLKASVGINDDDPYWIYKLAENHIYGSSRLGLSERNVVLVQQVSGTNDTTYHSYVTDSIRSFYRGQKRYELSNHLGNVLAVITDRRIQACGAGDVMYYKAQVVSVSDYYPFGMGIKEREWKDSSFSYRFGFNGKEQDNEVSGSGNSYDYGFRIYNPRLGKFLSVDPLFKSYPWFTPYQFAANDPIRNIDIDGLEGGSAIEDEGSIIGDVLDYYVDFMAKLLFNEEYETRLETVERLRQEKKTLEQPNAPAPPVKQDQSKPALKTTGADKVVNATQENSNQSSQKNVYLGNEVPFVSQYTLPNPDVACCRAAQKILKDFGLKNSGLKSNRIIVGRDNADKSGIAIIPSAAKTGIAYINEQLDKGNPVMVGVNHTTGKGQGDGEAADHFVVITGRSTDENGATSYSFYEVGTSHEDKGKSLENKLYLGSDNSLTGTNYAKKKQFTVTDIRKNGK